MTTLQKFVKLGLLKAYTALTAKTSELLGMANTEADNDINVKTVVKFLMIHPIAPWRGHISLENGVNI